MTTLGSRRERWTALAIEVWATIGVLALLYLVGTVIGRLAGALVPFGLALALVVVLRGPVDRLARHRVPRALAIAVCYLGAVIVVTVAMLFILPAFGEQIGALATALPGYLDKAYKLWLQVTQPQGTPVVPGWVTTAVLNLKDTTVKSIGSISSQSITIAFAAGSQIVTLVIDVVLALIVAFYTLLDLPKLLEEGMRIVPERFREETAHGVATVSRILGGWMRGAFIDTLVVGALIATGLTVLGVPYGFAIGIIGGVLNIVPYLGPVVAAALAGLAGLFGGSPWLALWAVAIVFGVQQFDSLLLYPRIMSKNVDLHPVLVVFSLLTGATLFGVPGMLLAVPVAAICKGLFVYYYERRTQQSLCTEDGVLFRTPKGDEDGASVEDGTGQQPEREGES
ncbi:MAG: AI-2E family transporter [Coriobacteriia bacterium]|nr:AI-2E family transporter [Coriobacteriia bacterium]